MARQYFGTDGIRGRINKPPMTAETALRLAIAAARTSLELKLSMADSIILATAWAYDATLWTQDAHFRDIEGVRYIEKKG